MQKHSDSIYKTVLEGYPDVLTINDIGKILGICNKNVYGLLKNNEINHQRIGKKYIIAKIHLIDYLINFVN